MHTFFFFLNGVGRVIGHGEMGDIEIVIIPFASVIDDSYAYVCDL